MELLVSRPPALTSLQRLLFGWTTVVVALTRVWARSQTLWDWDEALFCLGVREYDVAFHHPHPPGFPLYVLLGKILRVIVRNDFRALQLIATVAAIALFPLLFWLARELRFPFRTSYLGALLFVFFPNVWFFGGTAFSDVPALTLTIAACATLLVACRDRRFYFAGAFLLGCAAAFRPQALAIGCAPALIASWVRIRDKRWLDVVAASAIGAAVLIASYGGAALASESVEGYLTANRNLREYVRKVDSYLNPQRAPVTTLFPDFFIRAVPGGKATAVVSALAAISILVSLIRRTPGVWILAAMFLPFNVMGLFLLDVNSISRYSVGYAAMYAVLAADGIAVLLLVVWRRAPWLAMSGEAILIFAIIARLMWWAVPALRDVRATPSPPVAAMQWIRDNVPRSMPVYIHGSLAPYASYMLEGWNTTEIVDPAEVPDRPVTRGETFAIEGATAIIGGHNFVRERGHMFNIARQRYFEVSVAPMSSVFRFGPGWYGEESVGNNSWRWMGYRSETLMPPVAGNAALTLGFDLPSELVPRNPIIEVRVNGQIVDRFAGNADTMKRSWTVPARGDRWNELVITIDKVINPAKEGIIPDARDLGLNLTSYSWAPAQ